jgi:hypothetical protein
MAKLDKSKYSKKQIQTLLAERRRQKESVNIIPKKINEHTNKSYAFVLGNGTSRKGIDPAFLQSIGKVYGCNALYREFDPDYLIAVDAKMILELDRKDYISKHRNVWTNPNKAYKNIIGLNYFKPSKGWSSGPTALHLASQHENKNIFILGFDYKGLENGKRVNNMYAGTPNYKKTTDSATYYGNWLKQTQRVIKENAHINYYRVIQPENFKPPELNSISNLRTITIIEFQKMFGIS